MRIILMVAFSFVAFCCTSQNHFVGFKTGVGFTSTSGDFIGSTAQKAGLNVGVSYEYLVSKNFSLSADVLYSQRGYKGSYLALQGAPKKRTQYNYNYLAIPIKVSLMSASKLYGFASVGLVPAFLVEAKFILPDLPGFDGGSENIKENVTQFDIGGLVELGGGYKISDRWHIFTAFTGQLSFNTFTSEKFFETADGKHYGFSITCGVKYALSVKQD